METLRVLIADDSAAVRMWLKDHLDEERDIEVVGVAHDGQEAVAMARETCPHVLISDYEMPGWTIPETLRELHREQPDVKVLMFSQHTSRGAEATMDALLAGASDYLPKPVGSPSAEASKAYMSANLVPKLRALFSPTPAGAHFHPPKRVLSTQRVDLVVVGVSTGGPEALSRFTAHLPETLPVPMLVVQHMPSHFTELLANRLKEHCHRNVREATHGMPLRANAILIAPGDRHLEVSTSLGGLVAHIHDGPPVQSCRPSVDVLFASAARHVGAHTLGVVMTGMGQDGLDGSRAIHDAGGSILVQDLASSVIWGMPGAVCQAGLADATLDPVALAKEVADRVALNRAEATR